MSQHQPKSESKLEVLHKQRLVARIFRAAEAAEYPVEQIEFTADGTIIVKPRALAKTKPEPNDWDDKYGEPSAA
jgi:hypothetical protein